MDLKGVTNMFSSPDNKKIHWGSAYSLWEVCRYKVIGIPVLDVFLNNVQDEELKHLLQLGINTMVIPHVEKIQKFLKERGLTYPPLPERCSLSDQEIARAIKEIIRLGLTHDMHAFMSTSRNDERNLLKNIMIDDEKAFHKIISISRNKGWLLDPPNINTPNIDKN